MKTEKETLLEQLAKENTMVLAQAYVYAKNLSTYGVDVTQKWLTAIENTANLERAYRKGWQDCFNEIMKERDNDGN